MMGNDVLVTITGGLFARNVAGDRGGAVSTLPVLQQHEPSVQW